MVFGFLLLGIFRSLKETLLQITEGNYTSALSTSLLCLVQTSAFYLLWLRQDQKKQKKQKKPKELSSKLSSKGAANTAACEQVFSWFRNYARVLNESRPCRHQFKVLLYAKMHNEAIARKKASYLNKFTVQTKVKGKSYACTKKPAAKK